MGGGKREICFPFGNPEDRTISKGGKRHPRKREEERFESERQAGEGGTRHREKKPLKLF